MRPASHPPRRAGLGAAPDKGRRPSASGARRARGSAHRRPAAASRRSTVQGQQPRAVFLVVVAAMTSMPAIVASMKFAGVVTAFAARAGMLVARGICPLDLLQRQNATDGFAFDLDLVAGGEPRQGSWGDRARDRRPAR